MLSLSQRLSEALMAPGEVIVRWRKGSELTVWIFRMEEAPVLIGYGTAKRNWRQDALHRDIFTMTELAAESLKDENTVIEVALGTVYPVQFKRVKSDGPKRITGAPGDEYRRAMTLAAWNKKFGAKTGVILKPEQKPSMPSGADKTRPVSIER